MVMDQYMSKTDELSDIQKKQYIAELGFEPILAHFNNEIKKHTCTPACDKMIELIEKRNRVFRLWRDELKEVDPGCLITSVNDKKRENEFKVMPLSLLSKIRKKITNIF